MEYDSIVHEIACTQKSIAVDLDGTLAYCGPEYISWDYIGPPIKDVVEKALKKEREGFEIKIFTARAIDPRIGPVIKKWLHENNLPDWTVTNCKDPSMKEIWDDLAYRVVRNKGEFLPDFPPVYFHGEAK